MTCNDRTDKVTTLSSSRSLPERRRRFTAESTGRWRRRSRRQTPRSFVRANHHRQGPARSGNGRLQKLLTARVNHPDQGSRRRDFPLQFRPLRLEWRNRHQQPPARDAGLQATQDRHDERQRGARLPLGTDALRRPRDSGLGVKEGVIEAIKFFTREKTWSLPR